MAVTLKQIAAAIGVSHQTVSSILNERSGRAQLYSAETRRLVHAAAERMGYRRNIAARAMHSGRFGNVALLSGIAGATSMAPPELLEGIDDGLHRHDLHLTLARLPDARLRDENYVPKMLRELACDGLLVLYNALIPQRLVELIERYRIPSVWINSRQEHDSIYPDDFGGGLEATRQLIALGHRRIAHVDYASGSKQVAWHYSNTDRREGYRQAMREAGLEPWLVWPEQEVPGDRRLDYTRRWMTAGPLPTAVLTYSNHEAIPIYCQATMMGLELPRQLSIVTFGARVLSVIGREMATMVLPEHEIGVQAVRMLMRKLENRAACEESRSEQMTFHPATTVAPPAG
jgi:LacI family transcriptional regulator